MEKPIFQARKLTKRYKKHDVLRDFNMEIRRGEIYGFIGRNGAGKTTLMRILAGRTMPTSGEIELFGATSLKEIDKQRIRMNGIVEKPALYPGMTARDNLEICRLQRGILDKECIGRALDEVGLCDVGAKKVKHFSLGMKQRLGLAMALLGGTEFLFLDEPANGLDSVGMAEVGEILKKLNQERGITILISSHLLVELQQLATCYGFIHEGRMLEEISADELQKKCGEFLHIRVDNAEMGRKVLQENFPSSRIEVARNTLRFYDPPQQHGDITQALVSAGVSVEEIALRGVGLGDYFTGLIENAKF